MLINPDLPLNEMPVLVLGAASIDIVGRLDQALEEGSSTHAQIRTSYGGTGRNFAENLARMGQPVSLLSVIGEDHIGQQLLEHTAEAGVDVSRVITSTEQPSGSYLAVVNDQGELQFALDDMRAVNKLTPKYLQSHAALFEEASLMFLDANLPEDTLSLAIQMAKAANLPVAADPTTASLALRLESHLKQITLITPNSNEAGILTGKKFDPRNGSAALEAAKQLVLKGVDIAIVTLSEFGVGYATSEISGHIPAIRTRIIDPTGAGDALSAAVVFALLNEIPVDEAVRLGVAAASLTLRHRGAVRADLSLELLYDQL